MVFDLFKAFDPIESNRYFFLIKTLFSCMRTQHVISTKQKNEVVSLIFVWSRYTYLSLLKNPYKAIKVLPWRRWKKQQSLNIQVIFLKNWFCSEKFSHTLHFSYDVTNLLFYSTLGTRLKKTWIYIKSQFSMVLSEYIAHVRTPKIFSARCNRMPWRNRIDFLSNTFATYSDHPYNDKNMWFFPTIMIIYYNVCILVFTASVTIILWNHQDHLFVSTATQKQSTSLKMDIFGHFNLILLEP